MSKKAVAMDATAFFVSGSKVQRPVRKGHITKVNGWDSKYKLEDIKG